MRDEASDALFLESAQFEGRGTVLADENFQPSNLPDGLDLTLISNRIDYQVLEEQGIEVKINDFRPDSLTGESQDYLLMRLPKSKVLSEYLFRLAFWLLKPQGRLIIAGNNQEGVKRIIKESEKQFGHLETQKLLGKGLRYAHFRKRNTSKLEREELLKDPYFEEHHFSWNELSFTSKAGIYGDQKIDEGSQFLVDALKEIPLSGELLDLGVGYGFLTIALAKEHSLDAIYGTENNITAFESCQKNLAANGVSAELFLTNVADGVTCKNIRTIVSNPPFHQGFSTSVHLTERFLAATKSLLHRKGAAYFVVNRFIAIERLAESVHLNVEAIAQNGQFKVLKLTH